MILAAAWLLAFASAAQNPEKDARRLKPLLPPPPPVAADAPRADAAGADSAAQPVDSGTGPRPLPQDQQLPFEHDRPVLEIDGARIMAFELNELVLYYRSFRPAATELLLMDAVAALIPAKVVEARFGADELLAMRMRVNQALAALQNGEGFAEVVRAYSDDDEAEDPEGRYTFGRERAVQPFDRVAFTAAPGSGPRPAVLTKYGFHLIEPLAYERGATPKDDLATMRHILVMYPGLKRLKDNGVDLRAWILEQVAACRIRVLQPGLENLVPPAHRGQIAR